MAPMDFILETGVEMAMNWHGAAAAAADPKQVEQLRRVIDAVKTAQQAIQHGVFYGLFPLCLALFILHEQYRAATDGGVFRVGYVLGRTAAIAACLIAYGKICSLILGVTGAGGGWMDGGEWLASFDTTKNALYSKYMETMGEKDVVDAIRALPQFLFLLAITLIVILCALFAYVAGLLLSISQGLFITILCSVGPTCICVSLVPGVGLGSSWARALAQVGAWSTIAGILTGLITLGSTNAKWAILDGNIAACLEIAGRYIVLAFATLSVPALTGKIFAGGAPAADAVGATLSKAWQGAKTLGTTAIPGTGKNYGEDKERRGGGAGRDTEGRSSGRFHKSPSTSAGSNRNGHMSLGQEAKGAVGAAVWALPALAARALDRRSAGEKGRLPLPERKKGQHPALRNAHNPLLTADVRAQALASFQLPSGHPGAVRAWRARPESDTQREYARAGLAAGGDAGELAALTKTPPDTTRAVTPAERTVLQHAFPGQSFEPKKLTTSEAGMLSVLGHYGQRFDGWSTGRRQGAEDFGYAAKIVEQAGWGKLSGASGPQGSEARSDNGQRMSASRLPPASTTSASAADSPGVRHASSAPRDDAWARGATSEEAGARRRTAAPRIEFEEPLSLRRVHTSAAPEKKS